MDFLLDSLFFDSDNNDDDTFSYEVIFMRLFDFLMIFFYIWLVHPAFNVFSIGFGFYIYEMVAENI